MQSELPSFDVPRFCARFLAQDHNALMGLRYVTHSEGSLELELPFNANFLTQDDSAVADGAIVTLLDMAGTIAVWSRLNRWRPHATVELHVDHLAPPPPEAIRGQVNCYHVDESLARVEGKAMAGTRPIASFAATYAFTDTAR